MVRKITWWRRATNTELLVVVVVGGEVEGETRREEEFFSGRETRDLKASKVGHLFSHLPRLLLQVCDVEHVELGQAAESTTSFSISSASSRSF